MGLAAARTKQHTKLFTNDLHRPGSTSTSCVPGFFVGGGTGTGGGWKTGRFEARFGLNGKSGIFVEYVAAAFFLLCGRETACILDAL